jgi:DNA-binding NarL/FixJ family response regulator
VRTALVCVRTPLAAQSITACATRLGVTTVRAAVSEAEALARLGERPAELILADTAVSRPDPVGFTRRVLALAPRAVLLLFGAEEPRVARAAVAAGARGLIRAGELDPVVTVTKALLLIGTPRPAPAGAAVSGGARAVRSNGAAPPAAAPATASTGPVLVPAQRADPPGPGGAAGRDGAAWRAALTERELQVLRGMAEGKSNAEIGRDLYLSEDTVKTHARRLFRKLRVRDRAQAVAVGFRTGALV